MLNQRPATELFCTFLLALALVLTLGACRTHEWSEASVGYAFVPSAPSTLVATEGFDEIHVSFSGTFAGQSLFLVKANVSDYLSSGGSIAVAGQTRNVAPQLSAQPPAVDTLHGTLLRDYPAAQRFNRHPPVLADTAFTPRGPAPAPAAVVYYGETPPSPALGDVRTFYVTTPDDTPGDGKLEAGDWHPIDARLAYVGRYCYLWVHDKTETPFGDNFDDSSASATDGRVTSAQIAALGEAFDGTAPGSYENGVFHLVSNVFGFEMGGGAGGDGGIDADQHISILVYDIDADARAGGMVGYFWAKDEYPQDYLDTYAATWGVLKSNAAEMFYLDAYFMDLLPGMVHSTLAHEYQHMIHFNEKYVQHGEDSGTWYNEMLSMLAEDLVQDKLGIGDADSPKARAADFNDSYVDSGVTDWLEGGEVWKSYASAYLFGAFLARNYGGAALAAAVMANSSVDRDSVSQALASLGQAEDFDGVFRRYGAALIYSLPPVGSDIKVINTASTVAVGPTTYALAAFDIYDPIYENSLDYAGPVLYYLWAPIELRPYGFSIHTDPTWRDLVGEQSIEFTILSPGRGVEFYLMVR